MRTTSSRPPSQRLRQYVLVAQKFNHANVGRVLGLSDGHGPLPLLVLPYFSNGDIINYLKLNPGTTNKEKTELVCTYLRHFFSCTSYLSSSVQAKGILAALAYLHRDDMIHGGVRGVSGLPPCRTLAADNATSGKCFCR